MIEHPVLPASRSLFRAQGVTSLTEQKDLTSTAAGVKFKMYAHGVQKGGCIDQRFLDHWLEVSGQLYAPAVLPPGKEAPVPVGCEVRWTPERVWTA
jgi:hypothetical protein